MCVTKKDLLTYWSSDEFLNEYFQKLEFSEPYAKAWGSIPQTWVTNPWRRRMKVIVFEFVRGYVKNYKKLPEGQHNFLVNWENKNLHWLIKCLKADQIVTFPKLGGLLNE